MYAIMDENDNYIGWRFDSYEEAEQAIENNEELEGCTISTVFELEYEY